MSLIPPNPTTSEEDSQVCTPEHCYYAFDTLFTTLSKKKALSPKFDDEKLCVARLCSIALLLIEIGLQPSLRDLECQASREESETERLYRQLRGTALI